MPLFDAVARGHPSAMSEPPAPRCTGVLALQTSAGLRLVENTRGYVPQSLRCSARGLRLCENFGEVTCARWQDGRTRALSHRGFGGPRDGYLGTIHRTVWEPVSGLTERRSHVTAT